jgi:NADH:ubiquinone oxidoreductase subunit 4 (subunit M)
MDNQQTLPIVLAIIPLVLGIIWKFLQISFTTLKSIGLTTIVVLGIFLVTIIEVDPSTSFLAFAVLLSGFCVMLCQEDTQEASVICSSAITILGLAFGVLLSQGFPSRLFLCGFLGYAAFFLIGEKRRSFRTTIILIHFIVAIILAFSSSLGGDSLQMFAGLFLAITFLPLAPFHLPFIGTIEAAKGTLSSFWIVVWLVFGLAELNMIYSSLTDEMLFVISWLALASAFYSSLAALGQKQSNLFVASATVAHVSLIWGLLNVFPSFPKWGIAFGIAVAFVLGGICLAFSFVRQRYGWQTIGKLPGLASPMPRFGTAMVFLVSFALFLPMFPTFSGLTTMPTIDVQDVKLIKVFFMFLAVWLGGGWFFLQMLHQTAFGTVRTDVPYTDLRITEFVAVAVLLLGATYSGLLY